MAERCTDVEPLLSAWLDAELDDSERADVEAHLGTCDGCRDEAAGLARTRTLVANTPARGLPPGLLRQPPSARPLPVATRTPARLGAVALLVVGFAAGVAYQVGDDPVPGERTVQVPVEAFVVDHVVHAAGDTPTWPMLVGVRP